MAQWSQPAILLKNILGLTGEPIAVKFLKEKISLPDFKLPNACRYCQMLMGARAGQRFLMTADNISCPSGAWALGFREPSANLYSGNNHASMGSFSSSTAARHTLENVPRFEMGKYKMVACCPLAEAPFKPDVVVLESSPGHLMWVALARIFENGGRHVFSTSVLHATCADVSILPFLTQKMNLSLGCGGCREATNLDESECLLGFPIKDLDTISRSLDKLNEKTIPRVRNKASYRSFNHHNPAG